MQIPRKSDSKSTRASPTSDDTREVENEGKNVLIIGRCDLRFDGLSVRLGNIVIGGLLLPKHSPRHLSPSDGNTIKISNVLKR